MNGSDTWRSIVNTGFRLVIGSWKITEMALPRILYISFAAELGHIRAFEQNFAPVDPAVAVDQTEDAHRGNALARAGLADDTERSSRFYRIAHAVDRLDDAAAGY